MRTPWQRPVPALPPLPPLRGLSPVTSRPLLGPVLFLLGVRGAAVGSAQPKAASDGFRARGERKARVSSTAWQRLPLLRLLFSTCPLVPRRKQARSSYSHVLC